MQMGAGFRSVPWEVQAFFQHLEECDVGKQYLQMSITGNHQWQQAVEPDDKLRAKNIMLFPWYQPCYSEKKTKQKTIASFWQMGWKNHLSTGIFICMPTESPQSFLILCNPMDCSLPGSTVHGILQARILEWVAIPFSRGSSGPRDLTCIFCGSCISCRFFTTEPLGKLIIYS